MDYYYFPLKHHFHHCLFHLFVQLQRFDKLYLIHHIGNILANPVLAYIDSIIGDQIHLCCLRYFQYLDSLLWFLSPKDFCKESIQYWSELIFHHCLILSYLFELCRLLFLSWLHRKKYHNYELIVDLEHSGALI